MGRKRSFVTGGGAAYSAPMQHTSTSAAPPQVHGALVVGVGDIDGIGGAVALHFAQQGLHVHVVGRTATKLDTVVRHIQAQGGAATAVVNHLGDEAEVSQLFANIEAHGQVLDVAVYNAAYLNMPRRFMGTPPSFIEGNWRLTGLAGMLVGQGAARLMLPQGRGTVIYTGATASLRGKPMFAAFASAKASLRAFAHCLAAELSPHGIHVAHVVIDGVVDGQRGKQAFGGLGRVLMGLIRRRNGALSPTEVARNYWAIHQQAPGAWAHELELRPFKEPF